MTDDMRLLAMHDADLAREVAELRKVVIRVLEIMESDKRSAMRAWLVALGLIAGWIAWAVWHV